MKTFSTIHDAADPLLDPGSFRVWYAKPGFNMDLALGSANARRSGVVVDPDNMARTHILLGSVRGAFTLDALWFALQGEHWSPNGEARQMIEALGLDHTSMSVGDCIECPDGRVCMAEFMGFGIIPRIPA